MTQQIVNVGSIAGDGTGDKGQVPFNKTNANFTELYTKAAYFGVDSGTVNAYTVLLATLIPNPLSFPATTGTLLRFFPLSTNTGASTLNGTAVLNQAGAALSGGELSSNGPALLQLTGSGWQIIASAGAQLGNQRTAAEIANSVTPVNYAYAPGDIRRYGNNTTPGTTDMTSVISAAFSVSPSHPTIFQPQLYKTGSQTLPAGSWVFLPSGCTLKDSGLLGAATSLINLSNNCTIYGFGATIDGNKSAYSGSFSAGRMGVMIFGSSTSINNVRVFGLTSQNCDGDGFYIGGSGAGGVAQNIVLDQCIGTTNRRQGLSITSANGADILNCTFTNQSGADPQAGIDIEANDSNAELIGIRIINPRTSGNTGSGIDVAVSNLGLTSAKRIGVLISGHTSVGDAQTSQRGGCRITGNTSANWPNKLYGQIIYRDAEIWSPGMSGVFLGSWDSAHAPEALIENVVVYDPGGAASNLFDETGVTVFASTGLTMASVGNFKIKNLKVYDDRGTPLAYTGCYLANNVVPLTTYLVEDVFCLGFTPVVGANREVVLLSGGSTNGLVRYSRENFLTISSSDAASSYLGKTLVFGAACVITVPSAVNCLGQPFKFLNGGAFTGQVRPTSGDVIGSFWGGNSTGDTILNYAGDELIVRATSSGHLSIEYVSDGAKRPLGQNAPSPQIWVTVIPTVTTFPSGTIAWNLSATSAQPMGWQWNAGTTTWKPLPNVP